jgi:hypothetical protein
MVQRSSCGEPERTMNVACRPCDRVNHSCSSKSSILSPRSWHLHARTHYTEVSGRNAADRALRPSGARLACQPYPMAYCSMRM